MRKLKDPRKADHYANLFRSRQLNERLSKFARSRVKELTLLAKVGNTPGAPWRIASGACEARLEQCQVVQFGKTQLTPVSMTCGEPSPVTAEALLKKAPAVAALEKEIGAVADRRGRGLEPMQIDSTTSVDLNDDKRPDRLFVVSFKETTTAEGGAVDEPPYACLVAEVNGAYQVLDGLLCTDPGARAKLVPAQAFAMQGVAGTFLRVEQQFASGKGAFLAHFGKGMLVEVRAGCGSQG